MKNYQWQGEPVKVEFGCSTVQENKEKPLYWYNYLCDKGGGTAEIPSIRITSKSGESFVINNQCGIGVHKLINCGWPNMPHSSLPDEGFEENEIDYKFDQFNKDSYLFLKSKEEQWMKDKHPKEYAKLESLKQIINRRP
ncbi:hypothetical protein [Reichenbachiella sp.]|uniref:hypothetical protein n=1 Tax=Reichenbachiella sp. TaxID=2184521 RepID=UPI003B58C759